MEDIIDLSENVNRLLLKDYSFLFPSETIKKMISTYPEKKSCSIKEVLSSKLTIASNNFLITNGSLEGMNIIIANLVQNNIGYLTPTFWGYGDSAKRYNKSVISAPLSD
ncbi:TPA: pyridoxal phosphate-dependent aminotransferase, partial [Streptococcus pneumoniae]|nr:pyridoxal phosphate-dependent aminotransferase [Streptococcus pneumoniae]